MGFDEELLRALAARGVLIGPDGLWARSPTYAGPNPPADELIRYFNATAERDQYDTNARLKCQWVENLWEVVQTLDREGQEAPWPYQAMLWVRLHGVLADLRSEWLTLFRTVGVDPATFVPNQRSLLELAVTTFRCIEAIRHALTEDELVYADYRRHTEGHPTQKSYDVRWSQRGGVIVDKHGVPSVGRELTVPEMDAAVRRVLAAHAGEPAIAVAFARRIRALLPPLVEAMRRLAGRPLQAVTSP